MTRRGDPFATKGLPDGERQNSHVEQKRAVINVPDVVLELLLPAQCVSTVDLSPTSDSRSDLMAARLLWRVTIEVLCQQRTRPHETHVTEAHVEQFRQF